MDDVSLAEAYLPQGIILTLVRDEFGEYWLEWFGERVNGCRQSFGCLDRALHEFNDHIRESNEISLDMEARYDAQTGF
jgi:hypothetical protein